MRHWAECLSTSTPPNHQRMLGHVMRQPQHAQTSQAGGEVRIAVVDR